MAVGEGSEGCRGPGVGLVVPIFAAGKRKEARAEGSRVVGRGGKSCSGDRERPGLPLCPVILFPKLEPQTFPTALPLLFSLFLPYHPTPTMRGASAFLGSQLCKEAP